jgi:2-polyprenyl-6-methoxyphenol hydroxylase-like FAD-dependent oxidoreductase
VHMDRWSSGRAVLIGDAGYCPTPLTGLGTSLALVGAYILAGELAAAPDHRAAFASYEKIMRPYVAGGQQFPPGGVSGYAPNSALMISMRAASMRMMGRWPVRSLAAKQFAKAADITLPLYPQQALQVLE